MPRTPTIIRPNTHRVTRPPPHLSATGWVADRWGGGRVTLWVFGLMMVGVLGILYFLGIKDQPGAFWGFFAMFLVLFFATGVGNASTFQMIPNIMRKEMDRLM